MCKIMPMEIRPAVPADIPGIIAVGLATWPATYAFAGPAFVADGLARWWSVPAIEASLADTTVLVAVSDDGDIVGVGNLDRRGETPIIWKLYVRPDTQGSGVGSALLPALVGLAGDRPVRLEYVEGNARAAAFYRRHGFVEISREGTTVWMERLGSTA
jgi:GNAT superfamily N-acetyltransferase